MRGVGGRADPTPPIQPERTHLELQHVQVRRGVESRATLMSPRWEAGGNTSNVSKKRGESPERGLSFSLLPERPLSPARQPVDVLREIPKEPEVSESFSVLRENGGVPIPPCVLCREVTDTVSVHTCDRPLPEKHTVNPRGENGGETAARPLSNSISAPEAGFVGKKVWAWERQPRVCEWFGYTFDST